jgi:hypothetical protein
MSKLLADAWCILLWLVPGIVRDFAGLSGAVLVSYGAWLVYPPLGFIVGGSLMIAGALLLALGSRSAG